MIFSLVDHKADMHHVIGKPSELYVDGDKLVAVTKIVPTSMGEDIIKLYDAGLINQHSIGFSTIKQTEEVNGPRVIKELKLYEGSAVLWGANPETPTIAMKSNNIELLSLRLESLKKAFRNGSFTNETFAFIETEIKRIEQGLDDIRKKFPYEEFHPTTDNIQSIAGLFSVIGVVGMAMGGSGKQSATLALNAMAGLVKGYQEGNKQRIDFEQKKYDDAMKEFDRHQQQIKSAFDLARDNAEVGVIILTGKGDEAFCSGGDISVRGDDGYIGDDSVGSKGIGRLNVLDLQIQIRRMPKPVIAMVAGWAIGGGHVLHVVCDLTIAAENAKFGQTGPMVGSFDGGYGAGLLARHVGQKKAREIWFLTRSYDAKEALEMGLVNTVVPLKELEAETVQWAREMLLNSPLALRLLKAGLNAADDGLAGVQQLAGDATLLFYMTEEGQEGRDAYQEKRKPDFGKYPKRP